MEEMYNGFDNFLHTVNGNFIALSEEETKINNKVLHEVRQSITDRMKNIDRLFREMYNENFYGGSYYDNLKISHPDEYDLDLKLVLPEAVDYVFAESDLHGFVQVKLFKYKPYLMKNPPYPNSRRNSGNICYPQFGVFQKLLTDNYLDTQKVLSWIEGILQRTLNTYTEVNRKTYLVVTSCGRYEVQWCKSGPAFTLTIGSKKLKVDLVPCFVFGNEYWPKGFKRNPFVDLKPNFFIIPKSPNHYPNAELYWRLSFQEQERLMFSDMERLKPALRLLKKVRDTRRHYKISSYYLKTVFLWAEENEDKEFWDQPLSDIFIAMLERYYIYLVNEFLPYYWDEGHDLFQSIDNQTIKDIKNDIGKLKNHIIHDSNHIHITKYFASPHEQSELRHMTF